MTKFNEKFSKTYVSRMGVQKRTENGAELI
jgi:hypothetical protein